MAIESALLPRRKPRDPSSASNRGHPLLRGSMFLHSSSAPGHRSDIDRSLIWCARFGRRGSASTARLARRSVGGDAAAGRQRTVRVAGALDLARLEQGTGAARDTVIDETGQARVARLVRATRMQRRRRPAAASHARDDEDRAKSLQGSPLVNCIIAVLPPLRWRCAGARDDREDHQLPSPAQSCSDRQLEVGNVALDREARIRLHARVSPPVATFAGAKPRWQRATHHPAPSAL